MSECARIQLQLWRGTARLPGKATGVDITQTSVAQCSDRQSGVLFYPTAHIFTTPSINKNSRGHTRRRGGGARTRAHVHPAGMSSSAQRARSLSSSATSVVSHSPHGTDRMGLFAHVSLHVPSLSVCVCSVCGSSRPLWLLCAAVSVRITHWPRGW
jgi:hypothetical protein